MVLLLETTSRSTVPAAPPLLDGLLVLRPWEENDAASLVAACNDDEIVRWLGHRIPHPYTESDAREFLAAVVATETAGSAAHFAIEDGGEFAGSISVRWDFWEAGAADVGYWVAPRARRRGVASAALRLVTRWAIEERRVARVQLRADVDNAASLTVAERAGFRREGVIRAARWNAQRGRRVDLALYSLLPGELD
jgi:RimJ/RimL family protein N-acetyltransferase